MITQRSLWITLLFSLFGSCKISSSNLNRVSGATYKDQKISKEECLEAREVQDVCWDEKDQICLPLQLSDCHKPNRMIKNDHHEPSIGSGKELRWPPKIGGRDSLPPARSSFKNRVGPAGIDWSNPKDVKPSGHKPNKNTNRLGFKDTNDYDGCLDCLPKKNRRKFSSPHKEKAVKTNRDTLGPDLGRRVGYLEKLTFENQDRIGKLEGIVSNLQKDNIATETTTHTTVWWAG